LGYFEKRGKDKEAQKPESRLAVMWGDPIGDLQKGKGKIGS